VVSPAGIFQTEIGNDFNDDESSDDEIERQMLNMSMQGKHQEPIKLKSAESQTNKTKDAEKEPIKSPEQPITS